MQTFDFGRSGRGSSTLAFKTGWGASPTAQPFYLVAARGRPPKLNPGGPTVQWLTRMWQRLPRPLADALGPSVCRLFLT